MRQKDASTSQWTAEGVTGAGTPVPAYLVLVSPGVYGVSSTGPAAAIWVDVGGGRVGIATSGAAAASMVMISGRVTVY